MWKGWRLPWITKQLGLHILQCFGIHCCGMLLDRPCNKTQINKKKKAIRKSSNSNAWKMHVQKEIYTSSEFCNQHSNDLKFSTLAQTKQNLEQLSLREMRLHCISPLKMGLTDGSTLCQMHYNTYRVHPHFSLFGLLLMQSVPFVQDSLGVIMHIYNSTLLAYLLHFLLTWSCSSYCIFSECHLCSVGQQLAFVP